MIAVVDYRKGNLKNVERELVSVGAEACLAPDPETILQADGIVLPGVGAFADAMDNMNETGQTTAIRSAIGRGVPFLGICLGMQLLFTAGMEGACGGKAISGLGIVDGVVGKLPNEDAFGKKYKVPHVGWNSLEFSPAAKACPLLNGVEEGEYFYFTHSYVVPNGSYAVATTTHSATFPSAIALGDRVFGVQFHPEKSSLIGERVLKNFADVVAAAR